MAAFDRDQNLNKPSIGPKYRGCHWHCLAVTPASGDTCSPRPCPNCVCSLCRTMRRGGPAAAASATTLPGQRARWRPWRSTLLWHRACLTRACTTPREQVMCTYGATTRAPCVRRPWGGGFPSFPRRVPVLSASVSRAELTDGQSVVPPMPVPCANCVLFYRWHWQAFPTFQPLRRSVVTPPVAHPPRLKPASAHVEPN